jgi:hypothetical protein
LLAAGALTAALLGSGLVSLTADTGVSEDNALESGTYVPPVEAHLLQLALSSPFTSCDSVSGGELTEGPIGAMSYTVSTFDLEPANVGALQADNYCIRNAGTEPAELTVHIDDASIVSSEVGACESSEVTAGDATCDDLAAGELSSLLLVSLNSDAAPCGTGGRIGDEHTLAQMTTPQPVVTLDPGEVCELYFSFDKRLGSSDDEARLLRAQTDRVTFDVVFTLQDA